MVGSDLAFGLQTGTCSKEGQDVPVNDGCPTLKSRHDRRRPPMSCLGRDEDRALAERLVVTGGMRSR